MTRRSRHAKCSIPEEDHRQVFHWTNVILGFGGPDLPTGFEELAKMSMKIGSYATELAEDRRVNPHDDLTTSLVQAEVDGERLSSAEIASFGFGGGGAHFWLGASLPRRKIHVLFEDLHREIPDIVADRGARTVAVAVHPWHQDAAGRVDATGLIPAHSAEFSGAGTL
jgi:cytochrome P450